MQNVIMLSVVMLSLIYCYTECHKAYCHYAEFNLLIH
jgi:hypothetical protein